MKFKGKILWFNPKKDSGYGFIGWSKDGVEQRDMFIHFSDIICDGFKTVKKGDVVEFGIGQNNKGQPKAIDVIVLDGTEA